MDAPEIKKSFENVILLHNRVLKKLDKRLKKMDLFADTGRRNSSVFGNDKKESLCTQIKLMAKNSSFLMLSLAQSGLFFVVTGV